jgi:hypothetical protein
VIPVALAAGSSSVVTAADATDAAVSGAQGKIAGAVVSAALIGNAVGNRPRLLCTTDAAADECDRTDRAAADVSSLAPEPAGPAPDGPTAATSAASAPSQSGGRQERSAVGFCVPSGCAGAASAALMGDPESAILALRKHAKRFQWALAEERQAL